MTAIALTLLLLLVIAAATIIGLYSDPAHGVAAAAVGYVVAVAFVARAGDRR
ncbi:MAG: hypothetical protein ACRDP1_08185 [Nocardioidaceae bacterium]